MNENKVSVKSVDECYLKIDEIQKFYEDYFLVTDIETQNKLRVAFWSLFSKILMEKLGGELRIAPKNDYCEDTPQLINFGNKFDKKGKRKWIAIGFDSWLNGVVEKKLLGTLKGTIEHVIEYYS